MHSSYYGFSQFALSLYLRTLINKRRFQEKLFSGLMYVTWKGKHACCSAPWDVVSLPTPASQWMVRKGLVALWEAPIAAYCAPCTGQVGNSRHGSKSLSDFSWMQTSVMPDILQCAKYNTNIRSCLHIQDVCHSDIILLRCVLWTRSW